MLHWLSAACHSLGGNHQKAMVYRYLGGLSFIWRKVTVTQERRAKDLEQYWYPVLVFNVYCVHFEVS